MATEPPLLSMSGITKSFPGVRALDGVDLAVQAGEVHCLLGQNGAGKSTLIKVLAGAQEPDDGVIRWQGDPVTLRSPIAAMRLGIATIYQELDLVEHLSVAENVHLGHEPTAAGFVVRGKAARAATSALMRRLGHPEIEPARLVGELSAAQQQIVSMARALSHDVRLIVMDEPSAALDPDEVDNLFRIVGDLTADGVAVVYISHRLEEIRRIGDRVTVLKDGRAVAGGLPAKSTPTREIVALMTGRNVEYVFPGGRPPMRPASTPGPRTGRRCWKCEGSPERVSSRRSTWPCGPERSSVSPDWSARGDRRFWRRSTERGSRAPVKSWSTDGRCAPGAYAPPSGQGSDSPPRNARRRPC